MARFSFSRPLAAPPTTVAGLDRSPATICFCRWTSFAQASELTSANIATSMISRSPTEHRSESANLAWNSPLRGRSRPDIGRQRLATPDISSSVRLGARTLQYDQTSSPVISRIRTIDIGSHRGTHAQG